MSNRQQIRRSTVNRSSVKPTQATQPTSRPQQSNNTPIVHSDEAIKINKILNLLNDRLKAVEGIVLNTNLNSNTTVEFDNNISLEKMNSVFSLMDSRISVLEKERSLSELTINVSKNNNLNENSDNVNNIDTNNVNNIDTNNVNNIDTNNVNELIESNSKINAIENKVNLLQRSVDNINITGITNNFIKLNNLIQSVKSELVEEITLLKKNTSLNKPSEEQPSEETPSEANPSEEKPSEEQPLEKEPSEEKPSEETLSEKEPSENNDINASVVEEENIKISLEDDNA